MESDLRLRRPGHEVWHPYQYLSPYDPRIYGVVRRRRQPAPQPQQTIVDDKESLFWSLLGRFKNVNNDHSVLVSFLVSAICFAGVTWQLYTIASRYLSYPMVSEVYVLKSEKVVPPALSLCFPWIEMLPFSLLNRTQDSWMLLSDNERRSESIRINAEYTVAQILNLTHELRDFKVDGFVRKVDSFATDTSDSQMTVEKFVKDDLVCYKVMNADALRPHFYYLSHQVTYGMEPGMTLGLNLDKDKLRHVSKFVIFLNRLDQLPRGDGDFPITYLKSKSTNGTSGLFDNISSIGIAYAKDTLKLLPPPFATNCFRFSHQKYESQYEWIHECVNNQTTKLYGLASFTKTFKQNGAFNDHPIMSKYTVFDGSMGRSLDRIIEWCNKSSPGVQCESQLFMPQLVAARDSPDVSFLLYDMSGPEMQLYFHPLTSVVDLYVQIISVIGAWLGVSCVDILFNSVKVVSVSSKSFGRFVHSRRSRG